MKEAAETLVSVVIPMHNRGSSIVAAVESALTQSVRDLEVIVVDDGSTDDGALKVSCIPDHRVRYIWQRKSGANAARNLGISLARGRYVAMLDSDDVFLPGHLERALAVLRESPDALVFARVVVDRGKGRHFQKPPRAPKMGEEICDYLMSDTGFVQTSTVVTSTEIARAVGYSDGLGSSQDTDFALRIAARGSPLHMVEQPGAIWRDRASGKRISAAADPADLSAWLETMAPSISARAYTGFRGWHIARALALRGQKTEALALFVIAAKSGCYPSMLLPRILGQIIFAGHGYRAVADFLLAIHGGLTRLWKPKGEVPL